MRALLGGLLLLSAAAVWAGSQRYGVLISDLHVGAGKQAYGAWKPIEDFRWQVEFDAFLDNIADRAGNQADLVLVGDVFELWQSPSMECSTDAEAPRCVVSDCNDADPELGCSEAEALARLRAIVAQHKAFVDALGRFAQRGSNRVFIVPGNHDAALLFPRVREFLQDQFAGTRVQVLSQGYWLSDDGLVYADHGHQFDDVNEFDGWPSPFVERDGVRRLRKPWGENMVQQFYNQYESVFPIIDNLSSEADGVEFALHEVSLGASATAVGRFMRFFLFQQSLRQAYQALGEDKGAGDGKPKWDYAQVRAQAADWFLDVFDGDAVMKARVVRARDSGTIELEPGRFTDQEIDAICAAKSKVAGAAPCASADANLSAAVKGLLLSHSQRLERYLSQTFQRIAAERQTVPEAYVYAHTHSARAAEQLTIDMLREPVRIHYANTGAFQRIATKAQIKEIMDVRRASSVMQIQPEQLPPCYSYVWLEPYDRSPSLQLMKWRSGPDGRWAGVPGSCLTDAK